MSAVDPFLAAVEKVFDTTMVDMRAAIDGAPPESLNWRPGGEDTNSIAVLATHSLHSTRAWLAVGLDAPRPARDRPSEFEAQAPDATALLAMLDDFGGQCRTIIQSARDVDWTALRRPDSRARPGADYEETAAWALVHALEHLREHVGQMALTRQMWEQRR